MPYKDPEVRRRKHTEYLARRYREDPDYAAKHKQAVSRNRKNIQAWLRSYKERLKCARCGESHPACLHFHHTDPNEKEVTLSLAARNGWSKAKILGEIIKCEVLCANCHAKHHDAEWSNSSSPGS